MNYYFDRPIGKAQEEGMKQMIEDGDFRALKEFVNSNVQRIHIGKSSFGKAFLFQARRPSQWCESEANVPWEMSLESVKDFLRNSGVTILDEYGKEYSFQSFWEKVEGEIFVGWGREAVHDGEHFVIDDNNVAWCLDWFT